MRFLEFEGEWVECKLLDIAQKITIKNKDRRVENVISNSAQRGLIPQLDFFDKEIANNDNTSGYYIIENGDYVYNPRKSVTAPYGPVNIYKGDHLGIVSPLYLCFKVKNINKDFLFHFFKSSSWHKFIYLNGDNGARHDRVSIKDETFFKLPVCYPKTEEQNKIVEFLSLIDQRIETQNKIIEELKKLKTALADGLYASSSISPRLKFQEFQKSWMQTSIGSITQNFNRRNKNKIAYPMFSVTNDLGFVAQVEKFGDREMVGENIDSYKVIKNGEFAYNPARINVGSIARYNGNESCMISSLYVCFRLKNDISSHWALHLFKSHRMNFYYNVYGEGGVRVYLFYPNFARIKVSVPEFLEQEKIGSVLSVIDKRIDLEINLNDKYQQQKVFLLKEMFI